MACHNRLCEHWEAIFPGRVFTVRYEELLADAQGAARKAAAFIGVDADAAAAEAWLRSETLGKAPEASTRKRGNALNPSKRRWRARS